MSALKPGGRNKSDTAPGVGLGWGSRSALPLVLATALLLRLLVGLHPYSGQGAYPKYGDYEAQRHWMELTLHTPASQWYTQSVDNDLQYWGLDYPPLSAYQSWLCGWILQRFDPAAFQLHFSRGYETPWSKLLLRWSVVVSDLLVLFPAVVVCRRVFFRGRPAAGTLMAAAALLNPAAVLIDHGHFQYNGISLGLSAAAAAAVAGGWQCCGAVLFSLALNHKQMAMYYAPAFFAHLLGWALQHPSPSGKVLRVARLGTAVIATFLVCWAPYLTSPSAAAAVLTRLAPVKRGLFEDWVGNFWCSTHVAIKWKRLFSQTTMLRLCTGTTLLALAPTCWRELQRPSPQGLLRCMAGSAFAFFMFSYQVHEKSVLLPLLPATLLGIDAGPASCWLPPLAAFSMFPLLKRDGLVAAYAAALLLWAAFAWGDCGAELLLPPQQQRKPVPGKSDRQQEGQHEMPLAVEGSPRRSIRLRRRQTMASEGLVDGSEKAHDGAVAPSDARSHLDGDTGYREQVLKLAGLAQQRLPAAALCTAAAVHLFAAVTTPPARLPYLHDAAFTCSSFAFLTAAAVNLSFPF